MTGTTTKPALRSEFAHFLPIQTRWNDNDVYGHVNNVVYYAYFDTVINRWLIAEGGLDPGPLGCPGVPSGRSERRRVPAGMRQPNPPGPRDRLIRARRPGTEITRLRSNNVRSNHG